MPARVGNIGKNFRRTGIGYPAGLDGCARSTGQTRLGPVSPMVLREARNAGFGENIYSGPTIIVIRRTTNWES